MSAVQAAVQRTGMEVIDFNGENFAEIDSADGYILINSPADDNPATNATFSSFLSTLQLQSTRGKPVLAIGTGAHILLKTGLIPGLEDQRVGIRLEKNPQPTSPEPLSLAVKFRLSADYQYNAFTRYLTPSHILTATVTTSAGCFVIPPGLLLEMEAQGLNVFCYCDARGEIKPTADINPTGSIHNIAAVANKAGNIMAMIPHPEHTLDGDAIFLSMRDHIASGFVAQLAPLYYWPRSFS